MSRYDEKTIFLNDNELYKEILKDRGVNHNRHYGTANLRHPTYKETQTLDEVRYVWKSNDSLTNLAYEFYNDPKLWWIIAWYNQTPTEHHIKEGQVVLIPTPLNKIISILKNTDSI